MRILHICVIGMCCIAMTMSAMGHSSKRAIERAVASAHRKIAPARKKLGHNAASQQRAPGEQAAANVAKGAGALIGGGIFGFASAYGGTCLHAYFDSKDTNKAVNTHDEASITLADCLHTAASMALNKAILNKKSAVIWFPFCLGQGVAHANNSHAAESEVNKLSQGVEKNVRSAYSWPCTLTGGLYRTTRDPAPETEEQLYAFKNALHNASGKGNRVCASGTLGMLGGLVFKS